MSYWLMKNEPSNYSIDDFERDGETAWTGVRNYQARNFMSRDMKVGDYAFYYHSNAEPSAVVGLMRVSKKAHADMTAFDKKSQYYEPKATKEKPIWECVDVEFVEKFPKIVSIAEIRKNPKLARMELLKTGSRLSIQPVSEAEFREVLKMASAKTKIK